MDFELAIWEMTYLLIAPKKVFRAVYYHVRISVFPLSHALAGGGKRPLSDLGW